MTASEASPGRLPATARIWKVYSVPLVRPVTVWVMVVASLPGMSSHRSKPTFSKSNIWYLVMLSSLGSAQISVTSVSPATAVKFLGLAGGSTASDMVMSNVRLAVSPSASVTV